MPPSRCTRLAMVIGWIVQQLVPRDVEPMAPDVQARDGEAAASGRAPPGDDLDLLGVTSARHILQRRYQIGVSGCQDGDVVGIVQGHRYQIDGHQDVDTLFLGFLLCHPNGYRSGRVMSLTPEAVQALHCFRWAA